MSDLQHEESEDFNDRVAELFRGQPEAIVRTRVKKIGRLRINRTNGEALGDVDVLVADRQRHRLLAVETKDLAVARTPAELTNELKTTFALGGDASSAADRHLERAAWLRSHLGEVLEWLEVGSDQSGWLVDHLFVVNHELFSPYMAGSVGPVLSYQELRADVDRAWTSSKRTFENRQKRRTAGEMDPRNSAP
jgi:hypothetical protein